MLFVVSQRLSVHGLESQDHQAAHRNTEDDDHHSGQPQPPLVGLLRGEYYAGERQASRDYGDYELDGNRLHITVSEEVCDSLAIAEMCSSVNLRRLKWRRRKRLDTKIALPNRSSIVIQTTEAVQGPMADLDCLTRLLQAASGLAQEVVKQPSVRGADKLSAKFGLALEYVDGDLEPVLVKGDSGANIVVTIEWLK